MPVPAMPHGPAFIEEVPMLVMDHPRGLAVLPVPAHTTPCKAIASLVALAPPGFHDGTWWWMTTATESRLARVDRQPR